MARGTQTTTKATTATKPAEAPTTERPNEAAAASASETSNQQAADAAERDRKAEEANAAADAQRSDIESGGTGALDETAVELAKGQSIAEPKAAPVDYSVQTARKPAQRAIPPEELSGEAMPRGPIATIPYGSEPRTFDPGVGLAEATPMAPPAPVEAGDGDDTDADVDRGSSAADRASRA